MSSKSDPLFELIHALSPNEKRYFKKYCDKYSTKESPKYLKLFNEIDAMDKFNGAKLKEYLENTTKSPNTSEIKNYLYHLILKSLRNFHADKNYHIRLQEYRTDLHLLIEKGLWKQAKKLLRQAVNTAKKTNLGLYELEFALLERRIIRQMGTRASGLLRENQERALAILRQIEKELNMTQIFEDIFFSLRTTNVNNPEAQHLPDIVNELIGEEHEQYLENASFVGLIQYYTMYAMYHRITKEYQVADKHLRKILALFEDNDYLLNEVEYQERYLKAINNYFNNCFESGIIEQEFDAIMSKLENIPDTNNNISAEKFHVRSYFHILYYSKKEEYNKILAIAPSILDGLKKYKDVIGSNRKLTLLYNVAIIYFETRDYNQALEWIVSLIKEGEKEVKKVIQFLAEMLRLILFYEKKEFSTLKYLARGFLDQFKKSKKGAPELGIGATLLQIAKLYDKPIRGKADQLEIDKKTKDLFIQLHNKIGNSVKREEIKTWLKEKSDGRI